MAVATKLGLADHRHPVSLDDFEAAEFEEGYKYELIDGRLYVSPQAEAPEGWLETWLYRKLWDYADESPAVINYVHNKARVFVPGRKRRTVPEPDIAAYHGFPSDRPIGKMKWRDVSPILVVEVLYASDPHKDLVRNVELYLQVPSVAEYWIIDARYDPDEPMLIVHRRRGKKWVVTEHEYGETYETKLLPGFSLVIDPRQ
jgi:Uma2 family endonuclease